MKDSIAKYFAEISPFYNDISILTNLNVDVYTKKNVIKVFIHLIVAYFMYSWNQINPVVPKPSLFAEPLSQWLAHVLAHIAFHVRSCSY